MINIKDPKGNPDGLDHDYEYRGSKRERVRNAPWYRGLAVWIVFAGLFLYAGLAVIIKQLNGADNDSWGATLLVAAFCWAIAGLFIGLMLYGRRRHQRLLNTIGKGKP